jgi:phosphoribosylformimino-5-aminoimidazole carboxamide ribotide isomerase
MRIIPAIDIIDGKCVRLTQGDYSQQKTYNGDPLDMAMRFEGHGLTFLHLVDLDGAREKRVVNFKVIERICSKTRLIVDFGGGLASEDDVHIAFECGVSAINVGSVAVKNRALCEAWLKRFGPDKVILSADTKKEKIVISGWQEGTEIWLVDLIEQYKEIGMKTIACTDVEKDGMMQGSAHDLYKKLQDKFDDLQIIASGGVSTLKELDQLTELKLFGAIIGRAIYEGNITLVDLQNYILKTPVSAAQ